MEVFLWNIFRCVPSLGFCLALDGVEMGSIIFISCFFLCLLIFPSCGWQSGENALCSFFFFFLNSKNPFIYWELTHFGDLLPAADMVDALLLTAPTSGFSPQRTVQLSELIL